jgi:hypothetical protein
MMPEPDNTGKALDARTADAVTIAWVIALNKPFYPLYVWYLLGEGVATSCLTMLSAPFFLAIPFIARRAPLVARVALPVVGLVDTLAETVIFGAASGTELFLAPCMMLAALSFYPAEIWWRRGVAALIFVAFFFTYGQFGSSLYPWSAEQLSTLLTLNAFAVASLMAFVALKFRS